MEEGQSHQKWRFKRTFKERCTGASGKSEGKHKIGGLPDSLKHKWSTPKDGHIGNGRRKKGKIKRKIPFFSKSQT